MLVENTVGAFDNVMEAKDNIKKELVLALQLTNDKSIQIQFSEIRDRSETKSGRALSAINRLRRHLNCFSGGRGRVRGRQSQQSRPTNREDTNRDRRQQRNDLADGLRGLKIGAVQSK